MDDLKHPVPARKKADFRGTVSFASLNAHNNVVSALSLTNSVRSVRFNQICFQYRTSQEEMIFGVYILLFWIS